MVQFQVISHKTLPWPVEPHGVFSWCPTMDLVAVTSQDASTLFVFRLNGQRVWSLAIKGVKIRDFVWRPDGKLMALFGEDGSCRLYDSDKGKLVALLDESLSDSRYLACCWSKREKEFRSLGKFDQLAEMDIAKSLPALSQLPNASFSESLKILSDDLLKCEGSTSDLLIAGLDNGELSLTLYGLFAIGRSQLKSLKTLRFVNVVSSEDLESHYAIMEDTKNVYIARIDTTFVSKYGAFLPVVSVTISQTLNIMSYLKGAMDVITHDCKPFIDFNHRTMSLLEDEIKQDAAYSSLDFEEPGFKLYDLLLTGMVSKPVLQWLTEYVGERGIKKWIKLGNQALEGARKVLFTYVIPGVERLILHLTKLSGYAKWSNVIEDDLGMEAALFESAIEATSDLLRLVYKLIADINSEQRLFQNFIDWLSYALQDITSDDPIKDRYFEVSDISEYITLGLNESILKNLVKTEESRIPKLHSYYDDVVEKTDIIFESVKMNMRGMIESGPPISIFQKCPGMRIHSDIRIVKENEAFNVICMLHVHNSKKLQLIKLKHNSQSPEAPKYYEIDVTELVHENLGVSAAFIDDREILLLSRPGIMEPSSASTSSSTEVSTDYARPGLCSFRYTDLAEGTTKLTRDAVIMQSYFDETSNNNKEGTMEGFSPLAMAVNGLSGRRVGCMIHQNHKDMLVFDLDRDD
ncbi:unnamed protein product [Kuraishia capsulata CBS 1993]|uniref:Anaphase-promoting complex subunit 4 n=1 Tax=Kuraishia capsulata CBS 1993 TaxID=1382522 RepID=W6MHT5_9ASCO|nr:uncharacterized protein KUCA_T00001327001 [Kuraishia capsulata CBS 1993]CDK25358.1 unnamed protein product [Kuraishia capsulata CBS 1993]